MAARVRYGITNLAHTYHDPGEFCRERTSCWRSPPRGAIRDPGGLPLLRKRELIAAVAGHPRPLRLEQGGALEEIVLSPNLPLGVGAMATFRSGAAHFPPDSVLLLYTDGVSDSRRGGKLFGVEGISSVWRDAASCPLPELAGSVCRESERFHEDRRSQDDRLVLAAQFSG